MLTGTALLTNADASLLLPSNLAVGFIAYVEVLLMLGIARRAPVDVRWLGDVVIQARLPEQVA